MQAIGGRLESSDSNPQPAEATAAPFYGWILSPGIDLIFACGGAMWFIWYVVEKLGVVRDISTVPGTALWVTWLVGVHFLANNHAFVGWHRVATSEYVDPEVRKKLGWLAAFFFVMLFPVVLIPGWANVAAKIYVLWLVQHYVAQAYGINMIYCLKRNYSMTKNEKEIMHWMFRCLIIMVLTQAFAMPALSSSFLDNKMTLPTWGPIPMWWYTASVYLFGASVFLFVGMVIRKYLKQKLLFPLPALLNTVSIIGIYFVSMTSQEPALGIAMTAFFHGSQNIVIGIACHLKERGLPDDVPPTKIAKMLMRKYTILYFAFLCVGGILLFVVLPRILCLMSVEFSVAAAGVLSMQGYHHFITERYVWRLRHPKIRNILVA